MYSKPIAHNVIVLGSHTTALYVVRSLGRCGAKVAVVDTHSCGEARFSKYCSLFTKIERFSSDEIIETVHRISEKLGPCAVFPTNDEAVKALSQSIDSIGSALATRELRSELRESGLAAGGPPPLSQRDRSRFLSALDRLVSEGLREASKAQI